jgi:hypothetical protein
MWLDVSVQEGLGMNTFDPVDLAKQNTLNL